MIVTKDQINHVEYDLNVFYEDLGTEDDDGNNQWADVYTIQPAVYVIFNNESDSTRLYMEAFKLSLEETRAIAPDFPVEDWGDDFFISLEYFLEMCKTLPDSVKAKLDALPPIESHVIDTDAPEIKWVN
jgi:hypothetical protein